MARRRRDPRAERAVCVVGGGARPRFDLRGAATQRRRRRRDLREERDARRLAQPSSGSQRPRFDALRMDAASPCFAAAEAAPFVEAPRAAPTVIVIETPAFQVLVVPDAANDRLSTHDRQLISAARVLASSEGAVVVLAPESCADLGIAGADRRVTAPPSRPSAYGPEARAAEVVATMTALSPRHVLFAETADGGDLARRVAVLTGEALFADAEALSAQRLRRPARNRRVEQSAAPTRLITIAPDAVAAYTGAPREARALAFACDERDRTAGAILDSRLVPADPATVPLAAADFVAAAGNGVTDFATFHQLVAALAATPGASRVLCDAGLMPRDRQVGASGTVLAASCYLALGIAGAPQHLQGVADCEHIVAVNTDLHAAMIERADLAIVQDAQLVMPALLAALARDAEDAEPCA